MTSSGGDLAGDWGWGLCFAVTGEPGEGVCARTKGRVGEESVDRTGETDVDPDTRDA